MQHIPACGSLRNLLLTISYDGKEFHGWLPLSIAVLDCKEVAPDFHARYSCTSKEYIYKIWNSEVRNPFLDGYALHYRYKIDENLLDKAAQAYVGRHDFTSFCTLDNREKGSEIVSADICTNKYR